MMEGQNSFRQGSRTVLLNRRFLSCRKCGWVHYVMTAEEKMDSDQVIERYQLDAAERFTYEAAFQQCLRCESPAREFRVANDVDVNRAAGHLVTPVFVDAHVGTQ